jgi:hypothetical protein
VTGAIYIRTRHADLWCAAQTTDSGHFFRTTCGQTYVAADCERTEAPPPAADRCRRCEPTALVQVGLRELAACAIEVNYSCYERLIGVDLDGLIQRSLDEEMSAS